MRNLLRSVVGAAILLLAFGHGGTLLAQYTTSTLGVSITDPSGAPVPGATITVRSLDTGLQKVSASGSSGAFTFNALPVGNYSMSVEKAGFSTFTQTGITLTIGHRRYRPFHRRSTG